MRAAAALASLLVSTAAVAGPAPGPFRDVIAHAAPTSPANTKHFTQASHLIYLNNCLPNGCTVNPGYDDSTTDHSSIPQSQAHLAAWSYGPDQWNQLVQCVKDMYAPFDIQVTDQDPGTATHFELMVGGNSTDVGIQGAGGVAPFVPCDGQLQDNVISFVFSAETSNLDYLCWAAAQETSHVFGLDHELNAKDPMTYLSPPIKKPGFQNADAKCGENTPRDCYCGGQTQNSAQYLMDTFGPAHLDPATLAITSPVDGAWVKPGFAVKADAMSQLSVTKADLQIDGATASSLDKAPLAFTAPATLAGGQHTISVVATDTAQRTFSGQVSVNVTPSCANGEACPKDLHCLGGYCLPGATVAGGLGADCADNDTCITGTCGFDGSTHACTQSCDAGMKCPGGYACLATSDGGGVCWPSKDGGGGCDTGGGGSPWLAFAGLGALVAMMKRRR